MSSWVSDVEGESAAGVVKAYGSAAIQVKEGSISKLFLPR